MEFTDGFNDVRDPVTGGPVVRCWGPDRYGTCPHVDQHGVVACAGHRIAPINGGPECWLLEVPKGAVQCPLNYSLIAPD